MVQLLGARKQRFRSQITGHKENFSDFLHEDGWTSKIQQRLGITAKVSGRVGETKEKLRKEGEIRIKAAES